MVAVALSAIAAVVVRGAGANVQATVLPTLASSTQFDVTGFLQAATVDTPSDPHSGGTLTVNGHKIVVPRETIAILPASALTWQELFTHAPAPWAGTDQTGMALNDSPKPDTTYEVHVVGNRVIDANGDRYIAGLVEASPGVRAQVGFTGHAPGGSPSCRAPSRSSPASGPTCRSRPISPRRPSRSATTASSWPAGATTSRSTRRSTGQELLPGPLGRCSSSHGLKCFAISNHLVGQAVCDLIDERHKAILPPDVWGDGEPEGVRQRAAQKMIDTARRRAFIDAAPEQDRRSRPS